VDSMQETVTKLAAIVFDDCISTTKPQIVSGTWAMRRISGSRPTCRSPIRARRSCSDFTVCAAQP
jgi:hypothetical protein